MTKLRDSAQLSMKYPDTTAWLELEASKAALQWSPPSGQYRDTGTELTSSISSPPISSSSWNRQSTATPAVLEDRTTIPRRNLEGDMSFSNSAASFFSAYQIHFDKISSYHGHDVHLSEAPQSLHTVEGNCSGSAEDHQIPEWLKHQQIPLSIYETGEKSFVPANTPIPLQEDESCWNGFITGLGV